MPFYVDGKLISDIFFKNPKSKASFFNVLVHQNERYGIKGDMPYSQVMNTKEYKTNKKAIAEINK